MTLIEAINRIDTVKPNTYSLDEKVRWLSTLDSMVKTEIIDTHEDGESVSFCGYGKETPHTTVLLVPAPFDEMYLFWLESKIDYWNGEHDKYNSSITMFNNMYGEYATYYNKNHMPLGKKRFVF